MPAQDIQNQLNLDKQNFEIVREILRKKFIPFEETEFTIAFKINDKYIVVYPYSMFFEVKGITVGKGIDNLLKQLKCDI